MPGYKLDKNLPATFVNRDLVRRIETCVDSWIESTLPEPARIMSSQTSVDDAFGRETFQTIDEMDLSAFPETTHGVQIERSVRAAECSARINITLSSELLRNAFRIIHDGPRARQHALALREDILRIVRANPTSGGAIGPLFLVLTGAAFLIASNNIIITQSNPTATLTRFACGVLLVILGSLLLSRAQQCTFDAPRLDRRREATRWFVRAIVAAALITPIVQWILARVV